MKPISLSIKGLHSFREEQVIHFENLCDAGVFGIFGPTGSGKSTILDAMTLALYGKVERASNNTQGIINHAENQLAVSFTFKLQTGHETAYRVERVFKRTDDVKVKTSICRLIEINEERTVLADKANEVSRKVEELLGLTIDDFTRAVVLPQGKFAEFLSLKGAERRQMLQRLFNLEQYGDRLVKQLKNEAQKASAKKNEMLAEQSGLGDAGINALHRAEQQLEATEKSLKAKEAERNRELKRFNEFQEIWELQQEQQSYLHDAERLRKQKEIIKEKEDRLQLAEMANTLKPYADGYLEARNAVASAEQTENKVLTALRNQQANYDKIQQNYEKFRNEKNEIEPQLRKQEEQLTVLKEIETKRTAVEKQVKVKQTEKFKKEEEIKNTADQLAEEKEWLERGTSKQNQLKAKLKSVQVSSEERKQCHKAIQLALQIKQRKQELELEQKQAEKHQIELSQLQQQKKSLEKEMKTEEDHIGHVFVAVQRVYALICETERSLSETVHLATVKRENILAKRDQAKFDQLTRELSKQLKKGEPCPVCGSTQHEKLVHTDVKNLSFNESELHEVEKLMSESAVLAQEFFTAKVKLEQQSDYLMNECPFLQKSESVAEVAASLEGDSISKRFEQINFEWKGIKQDLSGTKSRVSKILTAYKQATKKHEQLCEQMNYESKEQERLQKRYDELTAILSGLVNNLSRQFAGISSEQAEKWQEIIEEKDRAAEKCEEAIEKSVHFLKEKEQLKEKLTEHLYTLEKEQLDLHYSLESLNNELSEYQKQLKDYPDTDVIDEQLQATRSKLTKLNEQDQTLYDQLKKTEANVNQLSGQAKACQSALQEAISRLEKVKETWVEKSGSTVFADVADVQNYIIGRAEFNQLKQDIEVYWDQIKQSEANIKRITYKLNGRSLTAEKWEQAAQFRKQAEDSFTAALEERGAARKALLVIRENHRRFKELEAALKDWQAYIDRLDKLQAVFKGNAFVEYLAEEQLESVTRDASARLGELTRQRYAIEADSEGGFVMRDDANGGVKRPVTSLSGGETFLTSLALALALSAQIQLRGEYPLQFFFLDEGFGTLDQELLDTVITALENLQSDNLSVGVISHVQELRARLAKKLIVHPAEPSGKGTVVSLEMM
ncbi:exonuclease subunit SbcC [Bacillus changyiensis]|uniref:exonuclease subunit SbcC n=1 Tax=Bacillus changyiensis TaxID=3004103 RepID=UPI0022E1C170|nr:exonuclease subunit SbcC [Bacillus changyiensis]MDA1475977.1 SMC family ATPase [Bacillus changyiensis]